MKQKLNKYDFLAINRRMNQNFNAKNFLGFKIKNISKGEALKLNRKEHNLKWGKQK